MHLLTALLLRSGVRSSSAMRTHPSERTANLTGRLPFLSSSSFAFHSGWETLEKKNRPHFEQNVAFVNNNNYPQSPADIISPHNDDDEVLLNVLRCQLTYQGQAVTSAEAWFNIALRPRKPEGSFGRTAQDGHLDSHTAPELLALITNLR